MRLISWSCGPAGRRIAGNAGGTQAMLLVRGQTGLCTRAKPRVADDDQASVQNRSWRCLEVRPELMDERISHDVRAIVIAGRDRRCAGQPSHCHR